MGAQKVLCGKFSEWDISLFACGDATNNLSVYSMRQSDPLAVLCPGQMMTSQVSSVTACHFVDKGGMVLAGSNRGSISCWDLEYNKSICLSM